MNKLSPDLILQINVGQCLDRAKYLHAFDFAEPLRSRKSAFTVDVCRRMLATPPFTNIKYSKRVSCSTVTMAILWSLRGLSWRELAKRTGLKSWEHEVFGQAARLAFYYFLGIFPALLLLLVLLNTLSSTGSELRSTLLDCIEEIVPPEASALLAKTLGELNAGATVAAGALWAVPSAAWAIFNGTWAMMVGLNNAYGVKEERSWWKILTIGLGLTMSLGIMGVVSLAAMLYGSRAGAAIRVSETPRLSHLLALLVSGYVNVCALQQLPTKPARPSSGCKGHCPNHQSAQSRRRAECTAV
jgi:hypothetical protein